MCKFAIDRTQRIRTIGDGGRGIIQPYGECRLKKHSPELQCAIYNDHVSKNLSGSMISDACPVYPTGEFWRCKFSDLYDEERAGE